MGFVALGCIAACIYDTCIKAQKGPAKSSGLSASGVQLTTTTVTADVATNEDAATPASREDADLQRALALSRGATDSLANSRSSPNQPPAYSIAQGMALPVAQGVALGNPAEMPTRSSSSVSCSDPTAAAAASACHREDSAGCYPSASVASLEPPSNAMDSVSLKQKIIAIKSALGLDADLAVGATIGQANALLELRAKAADSLPNQADAILAECAVTHEPLHPSRYTRTVTT